MIKRLKRDSKNLSWHKSRFFPIKSSYNNEYKHIAIVGIGANIGDVKKRFDRLYIYFLNDKRVHISETSKILKNPPFGFLEQDDFLNAIIVMQTSLTPIKLLRVLQHAEKFFKRVRTFKNAPRTLDLDIIFFGSKKIMQKELIIPHPMYKKRDSVLLPLMSLKRYKRKI